MRRLHLFVPHLPLGLARARHSEPFPPGPLVLGGRPWDPGPVIDASPDARVMGVRRGMPLASAHRLVPEATFIEPDIDADRAAAEAVFEALGRSSPSLAGTTDPLDGAFGQFELGIDGLGPLWGPEPVLIERVSSALRATLPEEGLDLEPRVGIAGTQFAATIAAVHARPGTPVIVPPGDEAAFLATYPSGLLTTDPDVRARLTRFGLRRIGAVAELPGSALIARFGDEGARLHARARGEEIDPFRARRASERLALALPIEPPVEDLEPLRFVLNRLVTALAAQLTGRGLAADRALLTLELDLAFAPRDTPGRLDVEQRFPEPTADAQAVERLLFARLEREPPPAAVQRLELEVRGTIPAAGQQLPLFVPQAARTARLGWQLARLALTYGEDRVRRVAVTDPEAPLPEDRWAWQAVGLDGTPVPAGASSAGASSRARVSRRS
jgi:nucleotidyltransferase/DNA polymerase involved in DNA repair